MILVIQPEAAYLAGHPEYDQCPPPDGCLFLPLVVVLKGKLGDKGIGKEIQKALQSRVVWADLFLSKVQDEKQEDNDNGEV